MRFRCAEGGGFIYHCFAHIFIEIFVKNFQFLCGFLGFGVFCAFDWFFDL